MIWILSLRFFYSQMEKPKQFMTYYDNERKEMIEIPHFLQVGKILMLEKMSAQISKRKFKKENFQFFKKLSFKSIRACKTCMYERKIPKAY